MVIRPRSSGVGVPPDLRTRRGPGRAPGPYSLNLLARRLLSPHKLTDPAAQAVPVASEDALGTARWV